MYVREALNSRRNRWGFGDAHIADGVSASAMQNLLSTNRRALTLAFRNGQGSAPTVNDPGTMAAGIFGSMADAFANAFGGGGSGATADAAAAAAATTDPTLFEPGAALSDEVPPWVYWAGAGAVVVLVGAVVYKKRKG